MNRRSLQHSAGAGDSDVELWWQMLRRVYELGEDREYVLRALRAAHLGRPRDAGTLLFPAARVCPRRFAVTIADMGDFAPNRHAADRDTWCRATLVEWNRAIVMDTQ